MIRFKLGDTAHEAMVSLTYFKTSEEAESHNIFAKGLWKVSVERQDGNYKLPEEIRNA